MVTRVPILDVRPRVECGTFPVKAVEGEELTVRARVFGEGPAVVRAAVVLTDPDGHDLPPVPMHHLGNDHWAAVVRPGAPGDWTYRVQSWHDPIATWVKIATRRFEAEVDLEALELRFDGQTVAFVIDEDRRHRLLNGLDDIALTLQAEDDIAAYERDKERSGPVTTAL